MLNRDLESFDQLVDVSTIEGDEPDTAAIVGSVMETMRTRGCTFAAACKRLVADIDRADEAEMRAFAKVEEQRMDRIAKLEAVKAAADAELAALSGGGS